MCKLLQRNPNIEFHPNHRYKDACSHMTHGPTYSSPHPGPVAAMSPQLGGTDSQGKSKDLNITGRLAPLPNHQSLCSGQELQEVRRKGL